MAITTSGKLKKSSSHKTDSVKPQSDNAGDITLQDEEEESEGEEDIGEEGLAKVMEMLGEEGLDDIGQMQLGALDGRADAEDEDEDEEDNSSEDEDVDDEENSVDEDVGTEGKTVKTGGPDNGDDDEEFGSDEEVELDGLSDDLSVDADVVPRQQITINNEVSLPGNFICDLSK